MTDTCPICKSETFPVSSDRRSFQMLVGCRRCGVFRIEDRALDRLGRLLNRDKDASCKLSYALRAITNNNSDYLLTYEAVRTLAVETKLPTPPAQLDNLIYFLGESNLDPGHGIELSEEHIALIGARSYNNLGFIAESARNLSLIDGVIAKHVIHPTYENLHNIRLTIDGWSAYFDLKKGKAESRQAFMAMRFGDSILDNIYLNHFKEAVADTGFELRRLDEGQPAGLIDDHLRVEIRKSKFLIADLTHHNNGAYWEAGYAEGLGKQVIYTCRKDVFEDKDHTTHFDTNHHLTVVWEQDNLQDAAKRLKATIRATLPEDATMEDPISNAHG